MRAMIEFAGFLGKIKFPTDSALDALPSELMLGSVMQKS
jgi:hypothetical protein